MMISLRWSALGFVGSTWLCLAGCGPSSSEPAQRPIDSPEATKTANQRVDDLLLGLANSMAGMDLAGSASAATESVDSVLGGGSSCPVGCGHHAATRHYSRTDVSSISKLTSR